MIIKTYYDDGSIIVFDTDHMTESLPQHGNLLTNYEIDLNDYKSGRIWLSSFYYETTERYRDTVGPKGLPVARRRDGWSFLLADDEDVKRLRRMTVDDETVLIRVAGELVNVAALHWAFDVVDDIVPMAIAAHDHLETQLAKEDGTDVEAEACSMMGFTREAYRCITGTARSNRTDEDSEEARDLF